MSTTTNASIPGGIAADDTIPVGAGPRKRGGGPQDAAARAESAKNSTTHSLTATTVFPEDLLVLIAECTAECVAQFRPTDAHEHRLVANMGRAKGQLFRCLEMQVHEHLRQRARAASPHFWNQDRAGYIREIGVRLHRDPQRVVPALEQTKQGVDHLMKEWSVLQTTLRGNNGWNEGERQLAFDLLAIRHASRDGTAIVPAGDDRGGLDRLVSRELTRLRSLLNDHLLKDDEDYREHAMLGLFFEEQGEVKKLRRYESRLRSQFNDAWSELQWRREQREQEAGSPAAAPPDSIFTPEAEEPELPARPVMSDAAKRHADRVLHDILCGGETDAKIAMAEAALNESNEVAAQAPASTEPEPEPVVEGPRPAPAVAVAPPPAPEPARNAPAQPEKQHGRRQQQDRKRKRGLEKQARRNGRRKNR